MAFFKSLALALLLLCGATTFAVADNGKVEPHVFGDPKAPVVVDEFLSFTCSHCAEYFTKTFPEIQKKYIETGKVRFVAHDFPLDGMALRASALAACVPSENYAAFSSAVFAQLEQWATAKDPMKPLSQYAGFAGVSSEKAKACLEDNALMDKIVDARTEAQKKYDIKATPTFIINGDEKIMGAVSFAKFSEALDRALAAKK